MELPSFLQRTPEQIEQENQRQQVLRDLHSRVRQSPAEMRVGRAIFLEPTIRANFALVKRGTPTYKETKAQLAENLAEQGRYAEAIKLAEGDAKKEYKAILRAIEKDESCNCPPQIHKDGQTRIEVPQDFIVQEVYSDGRIVPLKRCAQCGTENAK